MEDAAGSPLVIGALERGMKEPTEPAGRLKPSVGCDDSRVRALKREVLCITCPSAGTFREHT
jgi:hypothetical protein